MCCTTVSGWAIWLATPRLRTPTQAGAPGLDEERPRRDRLPFRPTSVQRSSTPADSAGVERAFLSFVAAACAVFLLRPREEARHVACGVSLERADGRLLCNAEARRWGTRNCPGRDFVTGQRVGDCEPVAMDPVALAALRVPVDLNAASAEALTSLPGVGPVTAARIVAGRPYAALQDLIEVRGIGPKRLARLRSRAVIELAPWTGPNSVATTSFFDRRDALRSPGAQHVGGRVRDEHVVLDTDTRAE